jgi:hypothetical protein
MTTLHCGDVNCLSVNFQSGPAIVTMVLFKGYVATCEGLRAQKWCGTKPPSTNSTIMFLNDIRSPCHLHVISTHTTHYCLSSHHPTLVLHSPPCNTNPLISPISSTHPVFLLETLLHIFCSQTTHHR